MSRIMTYMSHVSYNDVHESCLLQWRTWVMSLIMTYMSHVSYNDVHECQPATRPPTREQDIHTYTHTWHTHTHTQTWYTHTWYTHTWLTHTHRHDTPTHTHTWCPHTWHTHITHTHTHTHVSVSHNTGNRTGSRNVAEFACADVCASALQRDPPLERWERRPVTCQNRLIIPQKRPITCQNRLIIRQKRPIPGENRSKETYWLKEAYHIISKSTRYTKRWVEALQRFKGEEGMRLTSVVGSRHCVCGGVSRSLDPTTFVSRPHHL
jgi:hypothetical protein